MRQLDIESPNACTLEEAIQKKDLAFQDYYNNVKKKDEALRITFLEKKAAQMAQETNSDASTVLLQLRDREKMRKSNRRIDWTLEKHKGAGVTEFQWRMIKALIGILPINSALNQRVFQNLKRNFAKLNRPWLSILGFNGKTRGSQDILNGTLEYLLEIIFMRKILWGM